MRPLREEKPTAMSEVMLVRWPEDGQEGARLAAGGVAVLYLVETDADPPAPKTCIEDWVRVPGDDRDLSARVAALEMRLLAHNAPPRVDDDGRLHYRGRLVSLTAAEARLADALIARFGEVVPDDLLTVVANEGAPPSGLSLRAQMAQLRSRVRDVGLAVQRSRHRGYRLSTRANADSRTRSG